MSTPHKLRATPPGQKPSEVTRFKELWRKRFTDEQKREFTGWFSEAQTSLAEIRARVKARYGVTLRHDSQLSGDGALRDWCWQELANAVEAEWTASEEAELKRLGLTGEALRSALLDKIKARAYIRGDHKLGLAAVKQDLSAEALKIDSRKLALLEKKAAAFDQAKGVMQDKELTEEERKLRMRELFGTV